MFKMATELHVDLTSPGSEIKTLYAGFHDGVKKGVKPQVQYEPEPIRVRISHKRATEIVKILYAQLQQLTEESEPENQGTWP